MKKNYKDPKANTYSLFEFQDKYGTEQACEQALFKFAEANITEVAMIHSDAFKSYNALSEKYDTDIKKFNQNNDTDHLKWLHIMISNVKANILGTYHGLDGKYLQNYFDELCYRFNRRFSKKPILDHLLECCVWAPYRKLAELCK